MNKHQQWNQAQADRRQWRDAALLKLGLEPGQSVVLEDGETLDDGLCRLLVAAGEREFANDTPFNLRLNLEHAKWKSNT